MPATAPRSRRKALLLLAAIAAAPLARAQPVGAPRAPTPADAEGPFYPVRFPEDRDGDLTRVAGHARAAQGTPLLLSGRVFLADGTPLADVRVELWQCDATGHYHHVDGDRPGDPDFQGYGVVVTDAQGRYAFRTIRPVPYASRPAHLHFKLAHPAAVPLTTQLYVRGDGDAGDPVQAFGGAPRRDRLRIALQPAKDGEADVFAATYDVVLARR